MKSLLKISRSTWLIVGIIAFVATISLLLVVAQQSFSHKVKQVTFTQSTGPVAPEFQQTTEVVITLGSCAITVSRYQVQKQTKSCPMDAATFAKVQSSISSYGVIDKMISNTSQAGLVGGKQVTMTIVLQDGTNFSAKLDAKFVQDMAPFFEEIQLLVPSVEQVIPSQ